jgi:hypothetical protein
MNTIAIYRAKLVLIRYTIVCAIIVAIMLIGTLNVARTTVHLSSSDANGALHTQTRQIVPHDASLPFDALLAGVCFGGLIVASALAGNLSRERSYLALVWTRPRTRTNEALTTIGVDLATIVAADVVLLVLAEIGLGIFNALAGTHVAQTLVAGDAAPTLAAALGASFMWYGIVAACTAPFARSALSWIAWPVFLAVASFYASHALRIFGLDPVMQALMALDPLAYFPGSNAFPPLFAWLIAALGCAVAVYGWSRKELTR